MIQPWLATDIADYPKTLDVDWENIFTTQISEVPLVNLYVRWLRQYDNTVPLPRRGRNLSNADDVGAVRKAGSSADLSIGPRTGSSNPEARGVESPA
jgi:hypothetical protein